MVSLDPLHDPLFFHGPPVEMRTFELVGFTFCFRNISTRTIAQQQHEWRYLSPTPWCRFHLHFTRSFFVQKCVAQLISNNSLVL